MTTITVNFDTKEWDDYRKYIRTDMPQAMGAADAAILGTFEKWVRIGTRTWEHGPVFDTEYPTTRVTGPGEVTPTQEIALQGEPGPENPYLFVDEGTRGPYPIYPKRAKALRFQPGYNRKTITGTGLGALPGGPFGGHVFRRHVTHPGIEPRNITDKVMAVVEQGAQAIFDKAIEDLIEERRLAEAESLMGVI